MMQFFFSVCERVVSIYSLACIIRIFLTWMPDLNDSLVGRVLSRICDPFLRLFTRLPFTRIGLIDFSPIVAIGVLSVLSMIFSSFATTGRISGAIVIALLVKVLWSFIGFILFVLIVALIVRLIYDFISPYGNSPFRVMLDGLLKYPVSYFSGLFSRSTSSMSYRSSLILTLIILIVISFGLNIGAQSLILVLAPPSV